MELQISQIFEDAVIYLNICAFLLKAPIRK